MNKGAEALDRFRLKKGWSQKDLAEFVGLDEPTISRLIRGIRRPNLEQALKLQMRANVAADLWLLGDQAEPEPEPASTPFPAEPAAEPS